MSLSCGFLCQFNSRAQKKLPKHRLHRGMRTCYW